MRPTIIPRGVFVGTTWHEKLLLVSVDKSTGRGDVYWLHRRDTAEGNIDKSYVAMEGCDVFGGDVFHL